MALAAALAFAGAVRAEDQNPGADAGMELWIKLGKPGPNQKILERMAGKWDTVTKMSMGPGQPETESKGTLESVMILGGRFLRVESQGEWQGHAFESLGIMGYDNTKEKFTTVSMDSTGTMFIQAEGSWNAKAQVLSYVGEYDDPFSKGKIKMKFRWAWHLTSADAMEMEMWEVPPPEMGPEYKAMTMTYSRRK